MSRGMRVHEIFSSQNLPDAKNRNDGGGKEHGGLSSKKTLAPLPPMKRFGGYKPKILSGNDDIVPTDHHLTTSASPPTSPPDARPRPILTKPKPFIIGDKDIPMVLGTIDNDDDDDYDDEDSRNGIDTDVKDLNIYDTVDDINTNGFAPADSRFPPENELQNTHFDSRRQYEGSYSFREPDHLADNFHDHNDQADLIEEDDLTRSALSDNFARDNPAFTTAPEIAPPPAPPTPPPAPTELEDLDTNGVHIPEPDYDEKEESLNFTEEDPDDLVEYRPKPPAQPMIKLPPLSSRVYLGEDYSHYLSDDEEERMTMVTSDPRKEKRSALKVSQRHSMFKAPSRSSGSNNNNNNFSNHNNNYVHSKNKAKEKKSGSSNSNSVRSFSYADSKFGTRGRSNGSLALKNHADDGGNFQDDSYESFLFSRHGHTMPSRISGASARDMGQWNESKSEEDRLWKKLTFRLKNKLNKNGYTMKEM